MPGKNGKFIERIEGLRFMPEKLTWDGKINLGTMLHLAVLLVTITLAWGAFDKRTALLEMEIKQVSEQQNLTALQLEEANFRTERIERYIISRDPKYLLVMPEDEHEHPPAH
jgi:hypothetical protein